MAIGDIFQLTPFWDNDGVEAQNVFTYEHVAGSDPLDSEALVTGFYNLVWPVIRKAVCSLCLLRRIEAVNMMDAPDFFTMGSIDEAGDLPVSASSQGATFDAWSVRYEKEYPGAPTGHKRFPGVAETLTSRNLYIVPQPDIDAILLQLALAVNAPPLAATFFPVIVKRPYSFAVPPVTWFNVTTITWTNLTTQNSRKEPTL